MEKIITIENLHESTKEEVFEFIKNHLLTQREKSETEDESNCLYRNKKGLTCAAGCLIPDDYYNEEIEDIKWKSLVKKGLMPTSHCQLIKDLQCIHDFIRIEKWEQELNAINLNKYD